MAIGSSGCGGYVLRGRVVEGPGESMMFLKLNQADWNTAAGGIAGAQIALIRDPDRPSHRLIGQGAAASDGSFAIPIDSFGAGWLEERWLIQAWRQGYRTLESIEALPADPRGHRLLIVMAPGQSQAPAEPENLLEEFRRHR